jgi:hypothetical protein
MAAPCSRHAEPFKTTRAFVLDETDKIRNEGHYGKYGKYAACFLGSGWTDEDV